MESVCCFDYPLIIDRSGCLSLFLILGAATGNYLQLHYHFHFHFHFQSQFILGQIDIRFTNRMGEVKDMEMLYADVVIYVFQDAYNLYDIRVAKDKFG